jgi:energy coupling factor transporter S component ThiW
MVNEQASSVRKITITAIFIALGVLLAPFSIPLGVARIFPAQHMINVLLAVFLGWRYSTSAAFCISSLRITLGMGTVLAYPGSMIGAFLSGYLYKKTNSIVAALLGEIFGTGVLGGFISYPLALFVLDSHAVAWYFVLAFLPSTITGSALAYIVYRLLKAAKIVSFNK